jgi:protein-disulfide isomerase
LEYFFLVDKPHFLVKNYHMLEGSAERAAKSEQPGKGLFERLSPILLVVVVAMAFLVGNLWQKVTNLEKGKVSGTSTAQTAAPAPQPTQVAVSPSQIKDLFSKDLVKFGDANRKVLFVDVSDPSCPYCSIAAGKNPELNAQAGDRFKMVADGGTYVAPIPEMRKLVDAGKASYVYIYSPGHGNGELGARALFCAYEKGKFWQVHDLLMSNAGYDLMNSTVKNDKTKASQVADFLKSVVDAAEMTSCIQSTKYDARLTSDPQVAAAIGVSGTPGFYVNTQLFAGAYSFTDMQPIVDAALK